MFTPALLILASASLASTALNRLGRTVDRTRSTLQRSAYGPAEGEDPEILRTMLQHFDRRIAMGERAMKSFCASVGIFVLVSLAIAIDQLDHGALPWLPLATTFAGMAVMLFGITTMLAESKLAGAQLRSEIETHLNALQQKSPDKAVQQNHDATFGTCEAGAFDQRMSSYR